MITAVVMVGEGDGATEPVTWVRQARRAATLDLIEQLANQPQIQQTIVVSPELDGLDTDIPFLYVKSQSGAVHVGHCLTDIAERYRPSRLLYFGGGSAPLFDDAALSRVIAQMVATDRGVFTNNQFASDWAGIVPASILGRWETRLGLDNMLGWVLSTEAGLPVQVEQASAATRLDIDTPTDLLTLSLHGRTRRHLRHFLESLPLDTDRLELALAALATPASQVFISGRIGPEAWRALNRVTRCWLRVISEERGMVSSGRLARGEVYSLLADHMGVVGLQQFFATLAEQAHAAFIDTRVVLAHHRRWPAESDRFASDLGLVEKVVDPWLRAFTAAALDAPIPIVLGGHGLLSGDLFAFCDLL